MFVFVVAEFMEGEARKTQIREVEKISEKSLASRLLSRNFKVLDFFFETTKFSY